MNALLLILLGGGIEVLPAVAPKIERVTSDCKWVTVAWNYPRARNQWKIRTMWNDKVVTNEVFFAMARRDNRTNFVVRIALQDCQELVAVQALDFDGVPSLWSDDVSIQK